MMRHPRLAAALALLLLLLLPLLGEVAGTSSDRGFHAAGTIRVNTSNLLRRWDGIGGLSAGASSRLLFDYPEPSRSDVLDMLFTDKRSDTVIVE
eukprot:SAG31_NODE_19087_length_612_cov_1.202729_1_plen_93_part_10